MSSIEHKNDTVLEDKGIYDHVENPPALLTDHSDQAVNKAALYSTHQEGDIIETIKKFRVASVVCFLAAFSAMTDGYQVSINGSIIANPGFVQIFGNQVDDKGNRSMFASILVGWNNIFAVGQFLGQTVLSFFADRYGRKACMFLYWFILALSVLLETVATGIPFWYPAKLFAGMGVGAMQMVLPTYIAEIAPVRIRGSLLMLYNFWFSVGTFLAPVILYSMGVSNPNEWKIPIYSQWAHIAAMLLIYVFLPESPAFFASRGYQEQGIKVLRRINGTVPGYNVEEEYERIALTIAEERRLAVEYKQTSWWAVFRGINGFRTLISAFPLMSQIFIGAGLIYTYMAYFFQIAGAEDPFLATVITNAVNLCTILTCIVISDKVGRRVICASGITICWLALFGFGILGVIPTSPASGKVLVLFACIWIIGLQSSGSAGFSYLGETASARLRARTCGFAIASTVAVGIGMSSAIPFMINPANANWGLKTAWFFVGVGAPFAIGSWFILPETSRRSPAELDELFEAKVKPWRFKQSTTKIQEAGRALNQ